MVAALRGTNVATAQNKLQRLPGRKRLRFSQNQPGKMIVANALRQQSQCVSDRPESMPVLALSLGGGVATIHKGETNGKGSSEVNESPRTAEDHDDNEKGNEAEGSSGGK